MAMLSRRLLTVHNRTTMPPNGRLALSKPGPYPTLIARTRIPLHACGIHSFERHHY